jgi:hypothetical protein
MTAMTTATMTCVSKTRNATTKVPQFQLDKCKASQAQQDTMIPSNLHPAKNDSQQFNLEKSLASRPYWFSNYDRVKCTESCAASHPRHPSNYDIK